MTKAIDYWVFFSVLIIGFENVYGISVISQKTGETVYDFTAQPGEFVPKSYTLQGYAVYADPPNACSSVQPPPYTTETENGNCILVARRFDCNFQVKLQNAQNAGYAGIIIHNVDSNETREISFERPPLLSINAWFIGGDSGQLLRDKFNYSSGYYLEIEQKNPFDIFMQVVAVVWILALILCFACLYYNARHQDQSRTSRTLHIRFRPAAEQSRAPAPVTPATQVSIYGSAIKKIPAKKWTRKHPCKTCTICLQDFTTQDKVKVLPCSHGFHPACIEEWLTESQRSCPTCRRQVLVANEPIPDYNV